MIGMQQLIQLSSGTRRTGFDLRRPALAHRSRRTRCRTGKSARCCICLQTRSKYSSHAGLGCTSGNRAETVKRGAGRRDRSGSASARCSTGSVAASDHRSSIRATPLTSGLPASPGAASGRAVFDPDTAVQRAAGWGECDSGARRNHAGRLFTASSPARAVLTARGGMTSHAAVVARGMGKCAVCRCQGNRSRSRATGPSASMELSSPEGDWLTLDGGTGRVFAGDLSTVRVK